MLCIAIVVLIRVLWCDYIKCTGFSIVIVLIRHFCIVIILCVQVLYCDSSVSTCLYCDNSTCTGFVGHPVTRLRHCVTSRKVAGSISNDVIGI